MKNIKINENDPLILNKKQAVHRSGGKTVFTIVTDKYEVKPFYKAHKMSLYWREDLDQALLFFKNRISPQSKTPALSGC